MTTGYSGTPLARKLSLKDGMRVWFDRMPESVRDEIASEDIQLDLLPAPAAPIEAAHVFVTSRDQLASRLRELLPLLDRAGFIWVSWPKKASKVPTDITEDVVRDLALQTTLVDNKVAAISEVWSGLRLVIRKEHRLP